MTDTVLSVEEYEKMKHDATEVIKILCGIYESGMDLPPGDDRMMIAEAFSTVILSLPRELLFAVVTNLVGERLSLVETVNVLSDSHIVADLVEAEKDIASGNLTPAKEFLT